MNVVPLNHRKRPYTAAVCLLNRLVVVQDRSYFHLVPLGRPRTSVARARNPTELEKHCRTNKARYGLPCLRADAAGVREWKPDDLFWLDHLRIRGRG